MYSFCSIFLIEFRAPARVCARAERVLFRSTGQPFLWGYSPQSVTSPALAPYRAHRRMVVRANKIVTWNTFYLLMNLLTRICYLVAQWNPLYCVQLVATSNPVRAAVIHLQCQLVLSNECLPMWQSRNEPVMRVKYFSAVTCDFEHWNVVCHYEFTWRTFGYLCTSTNLCSLRYGLWFHCITLLRPVAGAMQNHS